MSNNVSNNFLGKVYLLFLFFAVASIAIAFKIVLIQLDGGKNGLREKVGGRIRSRHVIAQRGNIYSEDGSLLVTSQPEYRIALDPTQLFKLKELKIGGKKYLENFQSEFEALCKLLSQDFGKGDYSPAYYRNKILNANIKNDHHIYLTNQIISYKKLKEVKEWPILKLPAKRTGFIIEKIENKRTYPYGELARVTLGSVKYDSNGISGQRGLEFAFNEYLKGINGEMIVKKITPHLEVPLDGFEDKKAVSGYDLVTTIDVDIQDIANDAIKKGVLSQNAKAGVAIIMEVETGKVKAIANYPEKLNLAVNLRYEPGSTFKTFNALAALEDNLVKETDSFIVDDTLYNIYGVPVSDHVALGKISLKQALEKSSNIAFVKMILKCYKDQPRKYLSALDELGIREPLNFDIKALNAPEVHRVGSDFFKKSTFVTMCYGYGLSMTPMDILTKYNAIANNGKMMKPYLVESIRSGGRVVKSFGPVILKEEFASPKNIRKIRQMLEGVVTNGTASKSIGKCSYGIAGKTGTTRQLINDKVYSQTAYYASFVGYFPAAKPKYSCFVLMDNPSNGLYYAGDVAVPVFKEISDKLFSRDLPLQIDKVAAVQGVQSKTPLTRIVNIEHALEVYNKLNISVPEQPQSDWVRSTRKGNTIQMKPYAPSKNYFPDMTGMSARDAASLLNNYGIRFTFKGHGKVSYQSLPPGYKITPETSVYLEFSEG